MVDVFYPESKWLRYSPKNKRVCATEHFCIVAVSVYCALMEFDHDITNHFGIELSRTLS